MALTTVQAGVIGNSQSIPVAVNFGVPIMENSQTISTDYCVSTGSNAMSAGPITIPNGVTLTIPNGSTYTVV